MEGRALLCNSRLSTTGFKPNVKLQGTAHNTIIRIGSMQSHIWKSSISMWELMLLQNCLYNFNNCIKVEHMAFFLELLQHFVLVSHWRRNHKQKNLWKKKFKSKSGLDTVKHFFLWNRGGSHTLEHLPGEVVSASSLSVFKRHLDNASSNTLLVSPGVILDWLILVSPLQLKVFHSTFSPQKLPHWAMLCF